MTIIKELKAKVEKDRNDYNKWTDDLKRDCQIQRAIKSGEMHNWFVCMEIYNMSGKELSSHWDKIKQDKDYLNKLTHHNEEYAKFVNAARECSHAIVLDEIGKGKKYTKNQLICCGFDKNFAEENGK